MLIYSDLDARPSISISLIYGFQWLVFFLLVVIIGPLVAGVSLGLNQQEVSSFIQRSFFFSGIASFLQITIGHRLPIIESVGGMWYSLIILVASMAPTLNKSLELLRTDICGAIIILGLLYLIIGFSGSMKSIKKLFVPVVNGTFLILMPISISRSIITGILGVDNAGKINNTGIIVAFIIYFFIAFILFKGHGFIQSIAILAGMVAGWIISVPFGLAVSPILQSNLVVSFPALFAWGTPTFDFGITLAFIITGFLIISNAIASIFSMSELLGKEDGNNVYSRSIIVTGLSNILAGIGAGIGTIPHSASTGFIKITGVASRRPFIFFSVIMILLGLFPVVSNLLASLPRQIGYILLLIAFSQLIGMGLQEYGKAGFSQENIIVIGTSLLLGTGTMFLPESVVQQIPMAIRPVLGNGLIVGLLIAIVFHNFFHLINTINIRSEKI